MKSPIQTIHLERMWNMKINRRIVIGIEELKKKKWKIIFPLTYVGIICFIWVMGAEYMIRLGDSAVSGLYKWIFHICAFEAMLIGIIAILMYFGGGNKKCRKIEKDFLENKIVDRKGNPPMVISKRKEKNGVVFEFYSCGISQDEFEKQKNRIEVVLGVKIISIEKGRSVRNIIVKGISEENELNKKLVWKTTFLDKDDFVLKLGKNYFADEEVDLSSIPHMLIGGGSGSGKSSLLKLTLYQCIKKDATVIIGDFKGGIDYVGKWREKSIVITEEQEFLEKLQEIVEIMKERQLLFLKIGASNIKEYNQRAKTKIKRIVIACDEFAQVFRKKDVSKEKKELHSKIEFQAEKIATLGRALGIHLILVTARPDSDVLDGKIKGNLGYRICGRADSVLSKIIIDKTDASELISQEDEGFFVTNFNTLFKAYYFEETCWEEE